MHLHRRYQHLGLHSAEGPNDTVTASLAREPSEKLRTSWQQEFKRNAYGR